MSKCYRGIASLSGVFTIVAMIAVLCLPATVMAGVVTAFVSVSGPGLESMSFNNLGTPDPNNDDVAGVSPNWVAVHQKAYNAVSYIDMVFSVADSPGAATEYIFSEGVHNGTGVPWTDYHLELGFGVGTDFVTSPPGDGLDFDAPDYNSMFDLSPFATVDINEDTIDAMDGTILPLNFHVFYFTIDVPDGITEFTVRQWPTVAPVGVQESSWGVVKSLYR